MVSGIGFQRWTKVVAFALLVAAVGCGDDDDDGGSNAGTGAGNDGSVSGSGGSAGKGGSGGTGGSGGSSGSSGTGKPDSGMGMKDAGPKPDAGPEPGKDSGTDTAMPDPCADVANKCTTAGATCDGESLVVCAEDADGCLVKTTTDCTTGDNDYCDESASTPACASCAATDCTEAGTTCDDDENLVVCANDANGCLTRTVTDCTAGTNDYCDEDATPDRCRACPATVCAAVGKSCDGTTLVTCTEDADGCLVATENECANQDDSNTCKETGNVGACVKEPCLKADGTPKTGVCVTNEPTCAENTLVTCVPDTDTCPIATPKACSDTVDPNGTPQRPNFNECSTDSVDHCIYNPCRDVVDPCLTEGEFCRDNKHMSCEKDSNQCLHEVVVEACGASKVCDTADPGCVACTNAAGCTNLGDKTCAAATDTLSTCTDKDNNGCLEITTEACGTTFNCNTTDGCKYVGPTDCTEALSNDRIIRASGMTAVFNTSTAVNDYGGYVCPQFTANLPFQAAAKDILFALEVPADSVINVELKNETGFTGTRAWMLLLEGCADTGTTQIESMCKAAADHELSYANEGNTTKRVYLVVDADNNGNTQNQGTFQLNVSTRVLGCADGERDGSEQCDDGNIVAGDGCSPTCKTETGYLCTDADPSVCTRRPPVANPVCGNVACPALAQADINNGLAHCCTTSQKCGVAYPPLFGNVCIERQPAGTDDADCTGENNMFGALFTLAAPNIPGCCNGNNQCGLRTPAGCTERAALWDLMQDGAARVYYTGPFASKSCNP